MGCPTSRSRLPSGTLRAPRFACPTGLAYPGPACRAGPCNVQVPVGKRDLRACQSLLLIEIPQGLDQLAEIAGDDGIELVEVQVNAVIRDAVLREIVRANALAAIAGANQRASLFGPFLVQFLLLHLVESAAQDTHGAFVVLVLAALVLALYFQAGR